jgi:ATP-dependent helicase/nuclease subunit B
LRGPSPSKASQVDIVLNDREVELAAIAGRPAILRRRLIADAASRESSLRVASPETTQLACALALGKDGRYARAFDGAIGAFRRAGLDAATLRAAGGPRSARFAEVLERIDERLTSRQLRDERGDAWLAASAARRFELFPEGTACVRGLSRYDAGELEFFEALHASLVGRGGAGLTLELPHTTLGPLAAALDRVARELEGRWAGAADHPALEYRVAHEPPRVELVSAHDDGSEARAVAHAALTALSEGVPLDRLAIAVPDLDEAFLEPLRQELNGAKIPFFEPRGRPPAASPSAHTALALMGLAVGPRRRDVLLDVLRTPGLRVERWTERGISRQEWAEELAELPLRVDRSGADLIAELEARVRDRSRRAEEVARLRQALLATTRCLAELDALAETAPRSSLRTRFQTLFDELGLATPSPGVLATALERRARDRRELLRALGDNASAMRALGTALERTAEAAAALGLEGEPVSLERYLNEVELAVQRIGPARGARRGAALALARPADLAGQEFDHVVLCRATRSRLDSAPGEGDLLLDEDLLAKLPQHRRPTSRSRATTFGLLAVAWLFTGARKVTVTHAERDGRGPTPPSELVIALKKLGVPARNEPASPLHPDARRTQLRTPPGEDTLRRARVDLERQAYFLDPARSPGPYTGDAGDIAALVGGTAERPISVTALENYAKCPFFAFAGHVLRALGEETPSDGIGVRERGSLVHDSLAVAHEAVRPYLGSKSADELEALALEAARGFLEKRGQSALRRAGLAATLSDVAAVVRWSLHEGSGLNFAEAERAFGVRQEWAPLSLGEYFVSGRIDRIDRSSDGKRVRIIDYKTGKPPTRPELERELLQPWLYADKVARELGASEIVAGYLSLRDRAPKLFPEADARPDSELVAKAKERAAHSLRTFASGVVPPQPSHARKCVRCSGRDLCRRPLSAPLAGDEEEA